MEIAEAVRCEAAFGMRVLQHLAAEPDAGGKNPTVSPISIHAVIVLLGAGACGATLDEIVALFGPAGGRAHALLASHVAMHVFTDSSDGDGGPKVQFANAVWVNAAAVPLKADYACVVAQHYRAQARQASFTTIEEARREINEWFEVATAGRINEFLPVRSVRSYMAAILGNALYFKGVWESTFDAQLTKHDAFYQQPAGEGQVHVLFMSSREQQYIACRPDYKVRKLLYACSSGMHRWRFAMYVYLPNEHHARH